MLCARSTAQSILPGLQPGEDSAAIAHQFVARAPAILDSLTALHFARLRISFLESQLRERERQRDNLAGRLDSCTTGTGRQISQRVEMAGRVSELNQKQQRGQVGKLLTWAALALSIYWHFKR